MTMPRTTQLMFAAGWLAILPACSKNDANAQSAAPGASVGDESPRETTPSDPASPGLATQQSTSSTSQGPGVIGSDAEIAKIVATVDSGEIEQAQLAQSRAKNPRARSFAEQMIQDHTKSRTKGAELAQASGTSPQSSDTSRALESKAMQTLQSLKNADAASFDATYMQAQVEQHREVMNMLTDQLIPAAKDAGLKTQLVSTRALVQHHLEMAMGIQQELAGQPPMH